MYLIQLIAKYCVMSFETFLYFNRLNLDKEMISIHPTVFTLGTRVKRHG